MDDIKEKVDFIISSFKNKNIIIILVSHQFKDKFFEIEFTQAANHSFIQNKLNKNIALKTRKIGAENLSKINEILKNELNKYSKRVIFLIFHEYFFSRAGINESERNEIIKQINAEIGNINGNYILFLLNFLYLLEKPLNEEEINELKIYLADIDNNSKIFNLKP